VGGRDGLHLPAEGRAAGWAIAMTPSPPAIALDLPPAPAVGAVAFVVPCALAIACAGNGMGFYDSPELAAAGAGLGITHPPGHPLFVVLAATASLLPVGAVAFRISILSALCLGAVSWLMFRAARVLAARVAGDRVSPRLQIAAALSASLVATLGTAAFRQATRAEVYALAALLAAVLIALSVHDGATAWRVRVAALALGLGAANHHFIALTASPLVLWLFVERVRAAPVQRRRAAVRSATACAVLFGLALVPYVLLPMRADAIASLPRVRTFGDWIDTASARVFARNTGRGVPGSAGGRLADVLDWFGQSLTPVGLLFAVGGLYLALRSPRARMDALRLALVVTVVGAARAYLGFVRDNPDAAGYLVPAIVPLALATAAFAVGSARALSEAPPPPRGPSKSARLVLAALLIGGPLLLPAWLGVVAVQASAADRTYAPEALATATLSSLPPRTVLFAYEAQTVFRLRYAMLVEGERPDVVVVPEPLLGYPGMIESVIARDRAIAAVLTPWLLRPERGLSARTLSALAVDRVVAIEFDPRNVRQDVAVVLPRGPVAQVMSEPTTLAAVRGASAAHFNRMDQLSALLDRERGARTLVDEILLWRSFNDALFFAARGARPEARRSLDRAARRAPDARELQGLRDALSQPGDGPIDIESVLPRAE